MHGMIHMHQSRAFGVVNLLRNLRGLNFPNASTIEREAWATGKQPTGQLLILYCLHPQNIQNIKIMFAFPSGRWIPEQINLIRRGQCFFVVGDFGSGFKILISRPRDPNFTTLCHSVYSTSVMLCCYCYVCVMCSYFSMLSVVLCIVGPFCVLLSEGHLALHGCTN